MGIPHSMLYANHLIHLCPKLCALLRSWWLYIRRNPDIQAAIGTLDTSNYSLILHQLPAFEEDAFGLIFSNLLFWWASDSHDWISLCGMNWKNLFLLGKVYGKLWLQSLELILWFYEKGLIAWAGCMNEMVIEKHLWILI